MGLKKSMKTYLKMEEAIRGREGEREGCSGRLALQLHPYLQVQESFMFSISSLPITVVILILITATMIIVVIMRSQRGQILMEFQFRCEASNLKGA